MISLAAGAGHLVELQHLGFEVEPFGSDTFLVRAAPASLAGEDPLRLPALAATCCM